MRIVLDLQGAQSASRFRGIGRYSLALAQAIVRNRGEHEVLLVLNGLLADSIEPIRAAFDGLLPQQNIRVWHAPGPVNELNPGNRWRRETAELVREAFLASLKPDVVHVFSLFEGFEDNAVSSIGRFTGSLATSVTLYDLIPLINPDAGLKANRPYMEYYQRKMTALKRADLLLAISEASRQEALAALAISDTQAINVSSAADARFRVLGISDPERKALYARHGIHRPFVLYVGAADERKNLARLIQAFAALPDALRDAHQLVIAGVSAVPQRAALQHFAQVSRLPADALCLAGEISDDDLVALYNLCRVLVFPSLHEGFGLPALEAMACGAVVIASNTSSLPEVMGRDDALFDPESVDAIAVKMAQSLSDGDFRRRLQQHGVQQARRFSWDASARRAISAFERLHTLRTQNPKNASLPVRSGRRPSLAFVSPLPPERTGIADYSAELLPALAQYYDIEVITPQADTSDVWVRANCALRSVEWFRAHAARFDRVLYQFGNSPFHSHMFDLLSEFPGVVVLHDFFLGEIHWHDEATRARKSHDAWTTELINGHGYAAIKERFTAIDQAEVVRKYPCNLGVFQNALGIITHSRASRSLFNRYYKNIENFCFEIVPLLRRPIDGVGLVNRKEKSRRDLGLSRDDFVVCSFGMLGPTKLNLRIIDAWLDSALSKDLRCILVFVGENDAGEYGDRLIQKINSISLDSRIVITGWVDTEDYRNYLYAADIAIQLRTHSRGEASAAILDCMNHGLPTIVNAHGSMNELPRDAVLMLPDIFSDAELAHGLAHLYIDRAKRQQLGGCAQRYIANYHAPVSCAGRYAEIIEGVYAHEECHVTALTHRIGQIEGAPVDEESWARLACCLAFDFPGYKSKNRIFIDVSELVQRDARTGIQRVVRSILVEALANPPAGFHVEPVYATAGEVGYRRASRFAASLLGAAWHAAEDELIDPGQGDIFLGLDLQHHVVSAQHENLKIMHSVGCKIYFAVYDLLPIQLSDAFPPGTDALHEKWLRLIASFDGVVCISESVAIEFVNWLKARAPSRCTDLMVGWFHLGADVEQSCPTKGLPSDHVAVLQLIESRPSFLMVGTVEPRKGYLQAIAAFEALWADGIEANLVIVGKEGWKGLPEDQRRTIPQIVVKLRNHPQLGTRLFWLEGISDEYLERVYDACTCLIAASEDEGFGLPLIEAAQHELPIIARDIPVFREVAGDCAYYFSGRDARGLAEAAKHWLHLRAECRVPGSASMPWLTWKQSTARLLDIVLNDQWAMYVRPSGDLFLGVRYDHRSPRIRWRGFHDPEAEIRWTEGSKSDIEFSVGDVPPGGASLELCFDTLGEQDVTLVLDGEEVFAKRLSGPRQLVTIDLPRARGKHRLEFLLPLARLPGNGDPRRLALALRYVCVRLGESIDEDLEESRVHVADGPVRDAGGLLPRKADNRGRGSHHRAGTVHLPWRIPDAGAQGGPAE
ncbi:MAG: glycosyltransferase [Alphaproteobacteria bacterium]|nr:glycosyltransferase [Alphaproteobacteria bacterium]